MRRGSRRGGGAGAKSEVSLKINRPGGAGNTVSGLKGAPDEEKLRFRGFIPPYALKGHLSASQEVAS